MVHEKAYDFSKGKRGAVLPPAPHKTRITIRLDADVIAWFRNINTSIGTLPFTSP